MNHSMRVFSLYLYSTKALIIALFGLVLLGTATLFGLEHIWSIPGWVQYLALTVLIVVAFVFSCYLAAKPSSVQIGDHAITIEPKRQDVKTILWEDVEAYAYYEELMLYSLKIALRSNETVSIIDFKWRDNADLQAFLGQFESRLNPGDDRTATGSVERSETFYGSKKKVVITVGLLMVYVCIVIVLRNRGAFGSWNPVWMYYFWVLPAAFFVKMLKAK